MRDTPATLVFYEAPHRLGKSLADCAEILGERNAAVARELTKLHEEIARGTLADLAARFAVKNVKGEIVLVIDRVATKILERPTEKSLSRRVKALEREGLDHKAALKKAAKEYGLSKSDAYRLTQVKRQK